MDEKELHFWVAIFCVRFGNRRKLWQLFDLDSIGEKKALHRNLIKCRN